MKGLLSLLMASCTNERREIRPLGDMSDFELRFKTKVMIPSPSPLLPLLIVSRSIFYLFAEALADLAS